MTATRWWRLVGATMGLGYAVRAWFVLGYQRGRPFETGDAFWYHFQAKLVADGRGFLNPFDFYKNGIETPGGDHPPGLVLILAPLDLIGIDTPTRQRLVLSLVGIVTIAVVAVLVRDLVGRRAGLIAAAITALYPNIWINDGMLQVETVYILAIAVALLLTHRILVDPTGARVVGLSAALLVAAMTRPEALLLYPLLVTPLVLSRAGWDLRRRFGVLALAALVPIAGFGPWAAYNATRFEEPVPISTGAGQTMAVANCDLTYDGEFLGFWTLECLDPARIGTPEGIDPSVRDPQYRDIALDYIGDHLGDVPKVVAARVGRVFHLFRPIQQVRLDAFIEGRGSEGMVMSGLLAYYVLAPLSVAGLVLLRRRGIAVWPELVIVGVVTFTTATSIGITRYRAGAEVVIVAGAAVAIDHLWQRGISRRAARSDPMPAPARPVGEPTP